jgi:TonB family protein
MSQFIPGADNPDNQQFAVNADREFQAVLALDPDNAVALESLASLHYNMAQGERSPGRKLFELDQAALWYVRILAARPDHKTAHYSLGVIAWARFYPELMQARQRLGMRPEDPGPLRDATARADLRARFGQTVDEGMKHLQRAIEIDPAYDDAMAYLNLLYRERADLLDSTAEYQRDVATADSWVHKALETKKAKAERQGGLAAPGAGRMEVRSNSGVPKQIRVGGNVQAAKLIEKPQPDYPRMAREARIQGVVRFDAMILKDGTMGNLSLVSGHPLLVPAATDAVRRYRYQPTLLNGEPVEVLTQIDVTFVLAP